jgi:hypothetical protein
VIVRQASEASLSTQSPQLSLQGLEKSRHNSIIVSPKTKDSDVSLEPDNILKDSTTLWIRSGQSLNDPYESGSVLSSPNLFEVNTG